MPGVGKNILVTGGGGYIGSHCILQLLQEDFNCIVVDNFVNCIKGKNLYSLIGTIYLIMFSTFFKILSDVTNPDGKKVY